MKDFVPWLVISAIFILFTILDTILSEFMRKRWRRQCNFNCENCRVWDCDKRLCDEQKRKEMKD